MSNPAKRYLVQRAAVLTLVLFLRASAQERFLLRIHNDQAASFARSHGLSLLSQPDDPRNPKVGSLSPLSGSVHDLYVATLAPGGLSTLRNDAAIQQVEADQHVGLPRTNTNTGSNPRQSNSHAAGSQSYFGTSVWSAYVHQPAADIVRLDDAHHYATGEGVVAFLDTGVDFTQPVLAASLNFGWDFTTNAPGGADIPPLQVNQSTTSILDDESVLVLQQSTTSILDQSTTSILDQSTTSILDGTPATSAYGHGTMVAGIIHLVAPSARLLPVKVFGSDGTSNLSTILAGLYWAVDHGAKVINMSFSMSAYSAEFDRALDYANSHRVICVASVGNDSARVSLYPAAYNQVMGVASTDNSDHRSSFSNYGTSAVTLAAPGEGVISTYPGSRYAAGWGTSFSAPFVSGAAALLVDLNGNLNEAQAQRAISQASSVGQGLGAGRLDLVQVVTYLNNRGDN